MRLFIVFFLITTFSFSQQILITGTSSENYPNLSAEYIVLDENLNVDPDPQVTLSRNGTPIAFENSCPISTNTKNISSILTIDVSGSMRGERLVLAKNSAKVWIESLNLPNSECAITSFSDNSYINQDFTGDANLLNRKIDELITISGTNYENGIYAQNTSASKVAERAEFDPVIVFLTDGTSDFDLNLAIDEINKSGAVFHAISLRNSMPQKLKDFSKATGGLWFENIESEEELKSIYKAINYFAQGGQPCKIEWTSISCESQREFLLRSEKYNLEKTLNFIIDPAILPNIEITQNYIYDHGIINTPNNSEVEVEIQSVGLDILINNININNNKFEIVDWDGDPPPFTLQNGDSRSLTVRFTPTNLNFEFATFEIESDACRGKFFYQTGGDRNLAPEDREIKLTSPNGGERFEVGSNQKINWEGTTEEEKVCVEYSIDNGQTWTFLGEGENGEFDWNNIPDTPSENCLARITLKEEGVEPTNLHIKTEGTVKETRPNKALGYLKKDLVGNYYFAGYYFRQLEIGGLSLDDPNITKNKIFIAKFDNDLNIQWLKEIDQAQEATVGLRAMTVDFQGNIFIGGFVTGGTLISDSGADIISEPNQYKFWIGKFNTDGNELNIEASGGSRKIDDNQNKKEIAYETVLSITTDNSGFVYVAGIVVDFFSYQGNIQRVNDGTDVNPAAEFYVAKLSPDLNYVGHGFTDGVRTEDIFLDYSNDQLAVGMNYVAEGVFVDPNGNQTEISLSRNSDAFLIEMNTDLQVNSSYPVSGQYRVNLADLKYDPDGNLVIFGTFAEDVELPSGYIINTPTPDLSTDLFVIKLIGFGPEVNWHKAFGSNINSFGNETARSLDIDGNGNIILAGTFVDTFTFENNTFENGNQNTHIFTMEFDSEGELLNSSAPDIYKTVGDAVPFEILYDGNGYVLSGYFTNSIFSEPALERDGTTEDIFITKNGFEEAKDCSELTATSFTPIKILPSLIESDKAPYNNKVLKLIADGQGNRYVLGQHFITTNVNEMILVNQSQTPSSYIAKINRSNETEWVVEFNSANGLPGEGSFNSDLVLQNGELYFAADMIGNMKLISKNSETIIQHSENESDIFIAKISKEGEILDNYQFGKGRQSNPILTTLVNGNIGLAYEQIFLDTDFIIDIQGLDLNLETKNSVFYIEFDPNIEYQKSRVLNFEGNPSFMKLGDLQSDELNNLFFAGTFNGTIENRTVSELSAFLVKINDGAIRQWIRTFQTNSEITPKFDVRTNGDIVFATNYKNRINSQLDGVEDLPFNAFIAGEAHLNISVIDTDGQIIKDYNTLQRTGVPRTNFAISAHEVFSDTENNTYISITTNTDYRLGGITSLIPTQTGLVVNVLPPNQLNQLTTTFPNRLTGNIPPKILSLNKDGNELIFGGSFGSTMRFINEDYSSTDTEKEIGFYTQRTSVDPKGIFDISDDLWEIYKVEPVQLTVLPEVDMGTVEVGDRREKTEQGFISVNSNFGAIVENVSFPDSDRFELVTGLPYQILPNQPNDFEFAFTPDQIALEESPIIIETDRGEFESRIFGNGFESNVEQLINPINFGEMKIQTQGKTLIEDVLRNNGISPYEIDLAEIIGPDKAQFNLNSFSTNILPANDILNANITFAPNRLGRTSSILALVNESSSKTWHVDLYGEGIDLESRRFNIYTENLEDETGNRVLIPIYVDDIDELIRRRVDTIYTELSFNESLLYPYEENNLGEVYARRRTIPYKFDINKADGNLLAEIPMLATLGDAQATDLDLNFSYPIDTTGSVVTSVYFDETDGEFRLSDICWDGGARLLTSTGKYTIDIVPNPAKEEVLVTFGIIETSNVKLTIFSAAGELIEEIYNEDLEYGFYEEEFELDLQNGSYILIIETISGRRSVNFQVVR